MPRGEYLVLLNNDAVVTEGWLEQLIGLSNVVPVLGEPSEVPRSRGQTDDGDPSGVREPEPNAESRGGAETAPGGPPAVSGRMAARGLPPLAAPHPPHPVGTSPQGGEVGGDSRLGRVPRGVGLVGPMTNYAAPPQLIEDVPYRDLDQMRAFARRWREEHRGQWFTVPKLSGFCLLMKREVYQTVGGLDKQFGLGLFDDDDLAIRARRPDSNWLWPTTSLSINSAAARSPATESTRVS